MRKFRKLVNNSNLEFTTPELREEDIERRRVLRVRKWRQNRYGGNS